jgi:hypothetical protein
VVSSLISRVSRAVLAALYLLAVAGCMSDWLIEGREDALQALAVVALIPPLVAAMGFSGAPATTSGARTRHVTFVDAAAAAPAAPPRQSSSLSPAAAAAVPRPAAEAAARKKPPRSGVRMVARIAWVVLRALYLLLAVALAHEWLVIGNADARTTLAAVALCPLLAAWGRAPLLAAVATRGVAFCVLIATAGCALLGVCVVALCTRFPHLLALLLPWLTVAVLLGGMLTACAAAALVLWCCGCIGRGGASSRRRGHRDE